ncbi:hypothetical protein K2173_004544 [Erythroxylum novogranatense]|uniref:Uncharacterized protein n=1 Tax=Erythroxylum novogranatense TaxID=1862640 RepID=A0AAV8T657_9ROSI|nr:hypothetical protein K2173_004544 [Erythroxylum novogranatense]
MGKSQCSRIMSLRKGAWSPEEDRMLIAYIGRYGIWNWTEMPKAAGLSRSGKSCRLRWMNYLRPGVKRGNFTKEEVQTITQMHQTLGNRWSTIASKLPGRTDNEVKNYWHTHLSKRLKNATVEATILQGLTTSITEPKGAKNSKENGDSLRYTPETSNWEDFEKIPMSPLLLGTADLSSSPDSLSQVAESHILDYENTDLSRLFEELEGMSRSQSSIEDSCNVKDGKSRWRENVWPEKSSNRQRTSFNDNVTNEKAFPIEGAGSEGIIPVSINLPTGSTSSSSSNLAIARENVENETISESTLGSVPEISTSGHLQDNILLMAESYSLEELLLMERGDGVMNMDQIWFDNSFSYHTYLDHQCWN